MKPNVSFGSKCGKSSQSWTKSVKTLSLYEDSDCCSSPPLRCIAYKQSRRLSFRAKGLDVPGMKLDNVKMLETPEDARQIHALSLGSKVVLVGTSFVGTKWCICFYICLDWLCWGNENRLKIKDIKASNQLQWLTFLFCGSQKMTKYLKKLSNSQNIRNKTYYKNKSDLIRTKKYIKIKIYKFLLTLNQLIKRENIFFPLTFIQMIKFIKNYLVLFLYKSWTISR